MVNNDFIKAIGDIPSSNDVDLTIAPGEDKGNWDVIENLRLVKEKSYSRWELRGGSSNEFVLPAGVEQLFSFTLAGTNEDYIAVRLSNGEIHIKLMDGSDSFPERIFTGFSTTMDVEFFFSNENLFVFDTIDGGQKKVYDMRSGEGYDYLGAGASRIISASLDSAGLVGSDLTGSDPKRIFVPSTSIPQTAFHDTVEETDKAFVGELVYETVNGNQTIKVRNDELFPEPMIIAENGVPNGSIYAILPFNGDILSYASDKRVYLEQVGGVFNPAGDFRDLNLTKAYRVVDILTDGSVAQMSGVISVNLPTTQLPQNVLTRIELNQKPRGVMKRYLLASKWQPTEELAHTSSTERYPNSNLFFHSDITDLGQTITIDGNGDPVFSDRNNLSDTKPDEELVTPASEVVPMSAGMQITFGAGQITPRSVVNYKGSMVIGGYTINRPVPNTTTDPSLDGNVVLTLPDGYDAATPVTTGENFVYVMFEYTDGTRSRIINSGVQLRETTDPIRLKVRGLNALVSKVIVMFDTDTIISSTAYKIFRQADTTDPFFNGMAIDLPTASGYRYELVYESEISATVIESVTLRDHLLVGVPPQQLRIDDQTRLNDNSKIEKMILSSMEPDKTQLRFRIFLFTTTGVHIGYLSDSSTAIFQNFENILENTTLKSKAMTSSGNSIVVQFDDGIYTINKRSGSIQKIIEKDVYDFDKIRSVMFNKEYNEYWIVTGGSKIIIFDIANNCSRIMNYSALSENILSGLYFKGKMLLGLSDGEVLKTDVKGLNQDGLSAPVIGVAETNHLGDQRSQVKLMNVKVYGQDLDASVDVDLQRNRRRGVDTGWTPDFSSDVSVAEKSLKIHGTQYNVNRRSPMPRVRLTVRKPASATGDGFIEHVSAKIITTENKGIARI